MIVLDASAAVELVLRTPTGARVVARASAPRETLHAPHLLDVEVAQALRRYEAKAIISAAEGLQALEDLASLDLVRYPHDVFLARVWQLRTNVTAYDACYLALAEVLAAPLLTCDARIARAPGHAAKVEVV